ncbi:thiamine diphosphokinase [Streptococcus suis]|uniref:Thiamine diphosphokinase n=1 Tax=Streptococcus suis TaxID=1307 RepID=A0A822VQC4_STRSU|nr:thiamine diphosphokinase [Streptococcus suis]AGZ24141.1 thiamine pyrophosphokinase [Streptococcus suis T15]MBO8083386.1 thiamine diphosphokinase [Streptococcus suis]MCB2944641.1 thiamine diphosphokinase [Streptococcus suis]MCB2951473.1 thiamine diphosphokinase [Streptococcus suis]MCB2957270.1 thiamine diphosphokinase [Streptococcus suis]
MIKIAVIAGGSFDCLPEPADLYVGVDAGSLRLLDHSLPLDWAIGDFDSVTSEELGQIREMAEQFLQAPAEKDDTDLELALKEIFKAYPQAQVRIYGALGGRMDHMMSNLFLPAEPDLAAFMEQIELVDSQNIIRFRPAGRHRLSPIAGMKYISFMPSDQSRLTIRRAKYPLDASNYFFKKCYSSNEFIDRDIDIQLDQGYVVLIYSKDRD